MIRTGAKAATLTRRGRIKASGTAPAPGGDSNITPSLTVSHTSGPAPLGVHFDAIASSSTRLSDNFRQAVYTFDYGDSGAGTWGYGNPTNNSKNVDVGGPLGFHVYETPGTYTVTLSVADGTGTNTTTATITVTDPDTVYSGANTICVNDSGTSDGLGPAGATYQSSMPNAATANGKRILMRRGQSTVRALPNMTGTQGAYFGAYGSGSKPVVSGGLMQHDGTNRVVLMDLQTNSSTSFNMNCSNALLVRCESAQTSNSVSFIPGSTNAAGAYEFNHIFFYECAATGPNPAVANPDYGFLGGCRRAVIAGCRVDQVRYHDIRHSPLWKAYIRHNEFTGRLSSSFYDTVKIHAGSTTAYTEGVSSNAGTYESRYIVFSENAVGNTTSPVNYGVSFSPQNTSTNEQVSDVICENNGIYASNTLDVAIYAVRVTTLTNSRLNGGSVVVGTSANTGAGGVTNGPNYTSRS